MFLFVARRTVATLMVLIVASFFVYVLTAYSGDPLQELRLDTTPAGIAKMNHAIEVLNLNTPPVLRYFTWLPGAMGCLIGQCDLGISLAKGEFPVTMLLGQAMGSTLQLITLASVLAIILGVAVGMTTALRQYSGYDYTVTFFTFVIYSLPVFWVAVLLKQYGAVELNKFIENPDIPIWLILVLSVFMGFVVQAVLGGERRQRLISVAFGAVGTMVVLGFLTFTRWTTSPSIGIVGVALISFALAAIVLAASVGFSQKVPTMIMLGVAAFSTAMWYPVWYLLEVNQEQGFLWLLGVIIVFALVGWALGWFFGGEDRKSYSKLAAILGALTILPHLFNLFFVRWDNYKRLIQIKNGVIPTFGSETAGLNGDTWMGAFDVLLHMVLPTVALLLVSFAGYTRYSRASLLEVMNQDYVRTARAKGLSERKVITRHAFRNAMIPIATIVALDIGGLIGGAVITEDIFGWSGMGALFALGLRVVDVNLVMGFFLVSGVAIVIFNVVADLIYSALDPRIRVS